INPWQQPWISPYNFTTKKRYKSMNSLLLSIIANDKFDNEPRWLTYKQALTMGYSVKKGERGSNVFLYSTSYNRSKRDRNGKKIKDSFGNYVKEDISTKPIFRTYCVFNAQQLNNCPELKINEVANDVDLNRANSIMSNIPVTVKFNIIDEAFYDPKMDEIIMPPKKNFFRLESFYSTLFHEAIHSTGAPNRLDRYTLSTYFSDYNNHCKEELVAELGSLSLCQECKFEYTNSNSVSYITSWTNSLMDEEFKLVDLYSDVSKALHYINDVS
ncbi:MAG: DUF1738 domain-containing protein, partial [Spirochaetaceae bacterium]|nr:DUF1738 domain-containing protein [Spirochaetaceae bacterium]